MQRGGDRGARGVRQPEQVCGSVSQADGDDAGGVPATFRMRYMKMNAIACYIIHFCAY